MSATVTEIEREHRMAIAAAHEKARINAGLDVPEIVEALKAYRGAHLSETMVRKALSGEAGEIPTSWHYTIVRLLEKKQPGAGRALSDELDKMFETQLLNVKAGQSSEKQAPALVALAEAAREVGEAQSAVCAGLADGVLDVVEQPRAAKQWHEADRAWRDLGHSIGAL